MARELEDQDRELEALVAQDRELVAQDRELVAQDRELGQVDQAAELEAAAAVVVVIAGFPQVKAAVLLLDMADSTPWQLTRQTQPKVTHKEILGRDLYNFTASSVSHGTNPAVRIPAMGPGAAGATPPNLHPQVVAVEVTIIGSIGPEYGINGHQA